MYFTRNVAMWKHFLKEYFIFTRKERTGIISIVFIIVFLMVISYAFPFFIKPKEYTHQQFESEIARLNIAANDSAKARNYSKSFDNKFYDHAAEDEKKYEPRKTEVFYFDPNTASPEDWKRLGVRDKTIATIHNYISKGGKFKSPSDITRIWGLSPSDQQRLVPYVSIKSRTREQVAPEKKEYPKASLSSYKRNEPIDINLADTSAYIGLPGIGSKLALRIVAFRDKLGGFYSVNQVGETYLLPDSTFQIIKPRLFLASTAVRQININLASVDEMKTHPYLRYTLANAIFQYRQQHGNFQTVADLKKIMLVTAEVYDKIAPYLSAQ
ncbi:MAG: helix-hairpin-helix domain-containing protein [Ginsengibacter sp.]